MPTLDELNELIDLRVTRRIQNAANLGKVCQAASPREMQLYAAFEAALTPDAPVYTFVFTVSHPGGYDSRVPVKARSFDEALQVCWQGHHGAESIRLERITHA